MINKKEKLLLIKIIQYCNRILQKTSNIEKDVFIDDADVVEICCFNLLQIGELVKNFDIDFLKSYPSVPWKDIKGLRDHVAHGYGTIKLIKIWKTIKNDIEPLMNYCEKIIEENK